MTEGSHGPAAGEATGVRGGGRYRRRVLLISAVALVVLAELGVRAISGRLPTPEVFYEPVAQAKDVQLNRIGQQGGADVVITGPSSALFGVDPAVLGSGLAPDSRRLAAYNAGIAAGVPDITIDWLKRYVLPRTRPTTVIWVLSTVDLNDAVRLPAVDSYFRSEAGRTDIWARLDRRAASMSALFRYRGELRSPKVWGDVLKGRPGDVKSWLAKLTPQGLATEQDLPLNEVARQQLLSEVEKFHVGGAETRLVTREIRAMQARGIRVILAEAPLPDRAVALHPHGRADLVAFQDDLQKISSATHTRLIPLPEQLHDDHLYQDYAHLDHDGAERYTAALVAALR